MNIDGHSNGEAATHFYVQIKTDRMLGKIFQFQSIADHYTRARLCLFLSPSLSLEFARHAGENCYQAFSSRAHDDHRQESDIIYVSTRGVVGIDVANRNGAPRRLIPSLDGFFSSTDLRRAFLLSRVYIYRGVQMIFRQLRRQKKRH